MEHRPVTMLTKLPS